MSHKRDFEDHGNGYAEPAPKRAKGQHPRARQHQNSGIDPTWGQKYVFSELADVTTIPRGEEDDFEDDADAMAYLMSVRQQASSIPHLLVAPRVQIGPQLPAGFRDDQDSDEEGEIEEEHASTPSEADSRGYYDDGAYVGISPYREGDTEHDDDDDNGSRPDDLANGDNEKAFREAYLASVRDRFTSLRDRLRSEVPEDAAGRLSSRYATDAPSFGPRSPTMKTWSNLIYNYDPHPVQVALLSKVSAIRILRVILGGKFLRQGYPIPERTSCWLWALLARLPDQGELNHTEIGWIRDLGRRAILLGTNLVEMAALEDPPEAELYEEGEGVRGDGGDGGGAQGVEEFVADILVDDEDIPEDEAPRIEVVTVKQLEGSEERVEREARDRERGAEVIQDEESSGGDDIAMDMSTDTDVDDGEIDEDAPYDEAALEEAKRILLARLVSDDDDGGGGNNNKEEEERRRHEEEAKRQRERMNMQATLNMIITVAGEFYGQRDLLEFREPFAGTT
ncbi:hypothetical protein ESCO_004053 [Escovopsis weberi]|uniref:Uncharacterized protein n=1 Tax=Escovopsis weberi TaxID=150374 RepID=A0A0M8N5L1_ESCWE|nr:hypothetical protein ESCO_004053 [Escovopsis weberi]